jgi:hypothetical protein
VAAHNNEVRSFRIPRIEGLEDPMAKLTVEELKNVLKTDAEFTDEQLAGLNKKQLESLANGYMRQADYDRAMNEGKVELEKRQGELATANERLNAEMAEWATLTAAEKQTATKQRADLEKAQADVLRLRQTMERIGSDSGVDVSKYLEGMPPPVVKKDEPTVDLSGYAKADDLTRSVQSLADMMLSLTPDLMQLSVEHQSLYGQPLDVRDIVKEIRTRAATKGNQKPLDPRAIWEEQHKVPEKRTEVEKKRFDDAIAQAEARGREAALSESVIPGQTNSPGRHSIIFGGKTNESKIQRPQPGETVAKAAAAFRTHKYATDAQKKAG